MIETLYIVLPGLFHSFGSDQNEPSEYQSLCKLLTKATIVPDRPSSFEGVLKQHFSGLPCKEIPAGALSALAHGLTDKEDHRNWMRADPVYLKSDAHGIYCLGNQHLHIEPSEYEAIIESLNKHFEKEDCKFVAAKASTWLLVSNQTPDIATNALADVEGRNIDPMLPSGPDAKIWHRRLTECQLLLNQHPVNLMRERKGLLPINSLWFWGTGRLPKQVVSPFDCLYSENKIMQGLSKAAGMTYYNKLENFDTFFEQAENNGHRTCAVVDSRIKRAHNLTDNKLRGELMAFYEKQWFEPIAHSLNEGKIKSIYIDACDGRRFMISKRHFKYFWRKNQNFMICDS